ncbi:MAG: DMT family transporter [Xanthomonadales bacterium]|nr:DMT family transporter [Xanthomonadales bacterium]
MKAARVPDGSHRQHDWTTPIELVALGAIWGSSFLFMRVAAGDFGPLALVELRLALGTLILLPFLWRARRLVTAALAWRFAAVGALGSAIPFTLFAWGAERAPAGIGAIANSMTVLFTVLVAFVLWRERIGWSRGLAMLMGFAGVIVLMSGKTAGGDVAGAALAGVAASFCYGFAANFTRRWFAAVPPLAAVAGTLGCAALMTLPLAALNWPGAAIPAASWGSAIALGVICTGVAYAFYFRLIQRVGAARASTSTYLIPVFGVFWGWLLLGEAPSASMLGAAALILASVVVAQRSRDS